MKDGRERVAHTREGTFDISRGCSVFFFFSGTNVRWNLESCVLFFFGWVTLTEEIENWRIIIGILLCVDLSLFENAR